MLMKPYLVPSIIGPIETRKYYILDARQSYKVMEINSNYLDIYIS